MERKEKDLLESRDIVTYKISIEYKKDIEESDLSNSDLYLNLSFIVNYVQSDNKAYNSRSTRYAKTWNFDYTGKEERLIIPSTGIYRLEVWGAQGGSSNSGVSNPNGRYGFYSIGNIDFFSGNEIYINFGGQDVNVLKQTQGTSGDYNGGGAVGGGATHIALDSGLLENLSEHATDGTFIVKISYSIKVDRKADLILFFCLLFIIIILR